MAKFKIGDKVIAKKDAPYNYTTNGWKGTVVGIGTSGNIKVEGLSSYGRICGYWVESKHFDLDISENQRIVITTDGKATIARLYNGRNVVKFSESRCCPEDVFDFAIGAKIAVDRLFNIPVISYGIKVGDKVRVVDTGKLYTTRIDWICDNVIDKEQIARFAYGEDMGYSKGITHLKTKFVVLATDGDIAYISKSETDNVPCYLIGVEGLNEC